MNTDNDIRDNQDGMNIMDSKPVIINNEVYDNTENGLYLIRSNPTIKENDIHDNRNGIGLTSSSPTITDNTFTDNTYGIEAHFGSPIVDDNVFNANEYWAIYMVNTQGSIDGNDFTGLPVCPGVRGNGVSLRGASSTVDDNDFNDMCFKSIQVEARSNVLIKDNRIHRFDVYGIWVDDSTVQIDGNDLKDGPYAMIVSSSEGHVNNNTVTNTTNGLDSLWLKDGFIIFKQGVYPTAEVSAAFGWDLI